MTIIRKEYEPTTWAWSFIMKDDEWPSFRTVEVEEGTVMVDVNRQGQVLGVEVLTPADITNMVVGLVGLGVDPDDVNEIVYDVIDGEPVEWKAKRRAGFRSPRNIRQKVVIDTAPNGYL